MDIAEVAKVTGVSSSTLRFYEERGLIRSVGRKGLRRLFHAEVLDRLALISLGRAAGLSLDEIARMFTADRPVIDRDLLLAKADELDRRIKELVSMRDGLRHAAVCRAPSHFECPKFQRLLTLARKNHFRPTSDLQRTHKQKPKPGA
jgi:DNA-binding transcriptional MerR regulator